MRRRLFRCPGGDIDLPDRRLVLVDRRDGGSLVVMPSREVWDRGELTLAELTRWSSLVAATGSAMLQILPQLAGGCVNYWCRLRASGVRVLSLGPRSSRSGDRCRNGASSSRACR